MFTAVAEVRTGVCSLERCFSTKTQGKIGEEDNAGAITCVDEGAASATAGELRAGAGHRSCTFTWWLGATCNERELHES